MTALEQFAALSAFEDMHEEGLNIKVLQYWRTGFLKEEDN